jgi:hypothetical protein
MIHAGLPPQWDLAMAQSCAHELERALRDDVRCIELFTHMYGDRPHCWSEDLRGVDRLRFQLGTRPAGQLMALAWRAAERAGPGLSQLAGRGPGRKVNAS